ncbi:MFS transporter [Rubellimicrobium aerolatum]|uniref:MFS transporter n=1 Tax=Rubellimicrobium aerolatum TaxID=490979 RepID=A0ABW0SD34_9RHOB|nr:MFS transporter [Rubellimicrobium aerolatum]MBP1806555.1 fucose permease [Rubellimicrobium aerolatum]
MTSACNVPSDGAAPAGFASRLFASGALSFFLLGMLPALFGVALPVWSQAFGLAPGQGGTLIATYNAGAALAVAAGVLGLPGLAMRPALVAVTLGATGLALGATWGLLLTGALVAGLGFGILAAAVNRRFLTDFGPRGPGMVSLVNAIFGLGAILSPLLFLAMGGAPQAVFWTVAALSALALALSGPEPFRTAAPGLPPLSPRLLLLLLLFGAVVIESALIGLGASALVDLGFSETSTARLVSAFFLAFVAGRMALAAVSHRLPPDLMFLGGVAGATAGAALAILSPAWGFVLSGAFAAVCFPAFFVWATRLLGPDPRMGAAILASGLLAGTLGPVALRPILGSVGEEGLFWILSVFGTLLTAVVALVLPRARRLHPR